MEGGLSELGDLGRGGRPPIMIGHELHARADAQYREIGPVQVLAVATHALALQGDPGRSAGQHERVHVAQIVERCAIGNDPGVDLEVLEHPPFAVRHCPPLSTT